jgi:hypothetical protein
MANNELVTKGECDGFEVSVNWKNGITSLSPEEIAWWMEGTEGMESLRVAVMMALGVEEDQVAVSEAKMRSDAYESAYGSQALS